jgi:FkbM family methyltransferase
MVDEYYSQYGQDRYLDEQIFCRARNGFFLDVGANDGITYSNTCFFEKFRGWSGICIEPHPSAFSKLKKNRACDVLNVGVNKVEGILEFVKIEGYAEMLSGLKDKYDADHLKRIENEIAVHKGNYEVINIVCKRIDTILRENKVSNIDYCSIDIEGGEIEALESIDLNSWEINVMTIENNYFGNKLRMYLKKFGYKLLRTVECDELYRKRNPLYRFFS